MQNYPREVCGTERADTGIHLNSSITQDFLSLLSWFAKKIINCRIFPKVLSGASSCSTSNLVFSLHQSQIKTIHEETEVNPLIGCLRVT